MEGVAWATHKFVMHGLLWNLHEDHHKKNPASFFEKNDYFFLIFACPGIAFLVAGTSIPGLQWMSFIGLGITLYGFCYFIIHDVFIHQRFKWLRNANSVYFLAIRRAHKMHHKHLEKQEGECFGMLWVPPKYFREARKQIRANA
jgi:beta-carotene 3-hydroxylase